MAEFALDRREFIAILSSLGLNSFAVSHALSASNKISISPFVAAAAVDSTISLSDIDLARQMQSYIYVLTSDTYSVSRMATRAASIAQGNASEKLSGTLKGVKKQFSESKALRELVASSGRDLARKLEGQVSASGANALWVAALAAGGPGSSDPFIGSLPRPINAVDITQSMMATLTDAVDRSQKAGRVLRDNAYSELSRMPLSKTPAEIISLLPPQTAAIASSLLDPASSTLTRREVEDLIGGSLTTALNDLNSKYLSARKLADFTSNAFTEMRKNGFDLSINSQDLRSVGIIGSYIVGNIFNDQAAAKQISQGVQLANTAMKIGLMFSTGGIGVLAGVSGVMSGLGGLDSAFGGGGGDSAAVQQMLAQISAQIETLRKEMHERFDRIEEMQRQTLDVLHQLSEDLLNTRIFLGSKIDSLQESIFNFEKYVKSSDRQRVLDTFKLSVARARDQIETPADYPAAAKRDTLTEFLHYALNRSADFAFTAANSAGALNGSIKSIDRIDIGVGLLQSAVQKVSSASVPVVTVNPVEWARGVNAYLEMQQAFPETITGTTRNFAARVWDIGRDTRDGLITSSSGAILLSAATALETEGARVGKALASALKLFVFKEQPKRAPTAGWQAQNSFDLKLLGTASILLGTLEVSILHPIPSSPFINPIIFDRADLAQLIKKNFPKDTASTGEVIYFSEAFSDLQNAKFSYVSKASDPFIRALETSRVSLKETGAAALIAQVRQARANIGTVRAYDIVSDQGAKIVSVKKYELSHASVGSRTAWEIQIQSKSLTLPEFYEIVRKQVNDEPFIVEWLKDKLPLERALDARPYEEVAAAVMLIVATASWRLTDELDHPWFSSVASIMPRDLNDIVLACISLAHGPTEDTLQYLGLNAQHEAIIRDEFRRVKEQGGSGKQVISWHDLRMEYEYAGLVENLVVNWTKRAAKEIRSMASQVTAYPVFPFMDRILQKMHGFNSTV